MRYRVCLFAVLVSLWPGCQYPTYLPPIDLGLIDGHVVGSEPIRGATIEVWALDDQGVRIAPPVVTCLPGACEAEDGHVVIEVGDLAPPYLVTARGGTTGEFWSDEDVAFGIQQEHTQAVVTRWIRRQTGTVVLSPVTTLVKALADRRFALGMETTYADAVDHARADLGAHFGMDPIRTIPAQRMDASLTEDVRYGLALVGLSSITAEFAERSRRSIQSMNVIMLTDALVRDVQQGPGATFDGMDANGPIELDSCTPEPCLLTANTLRAELVRALAAEYLPSAANVTGLDFGDAAEFLDQVTGNLDASLFGGAPIEPIDVGPPMISALPSLIFDETRDRIDFDAERRPSHVHDSIAVLDLAEGFAGSCPQVHKHTDLLCSAMDNPLEWHVLVADDIAGVRDGDVRAYVGPVPDVSAMTEVAVTRIGARDGGVEYAFRALCADVPELKTTEGRFFVVVEVEDWTGNAATPLIGCWDHVPRAAPLWVGPPAMATGPGSLDDARLENNNLAALLRGAVTPAEPRALIEFEVQNNTGDDVYLTLDIADVVGTYSRTWIESRAYLRQDMTPDQCLSAPIPCELQVPRMQPVIDADSGSDLLNLLPLQWRVINQATGLEEICPECRIDELRIRRYGRYMLQIAVRDLGWLVPSSINALQIAEIAVGPPGSSVQLTGIDEGSYNYCARAPSLTCDWHIFYQLYTALSSAALDVQSLLIGGMTSVSSNAIPKRPAPSARPSDRTFADPLSGNLSWTTLDELPAPDPF